MRACPGTSLQGYVAWRGVVPEAEAPERVLHFIGRKFTVYQVSLAPCCDTTDLQRVMESRVLDGRAWEPPT